MSTDVSALKAEICRIGRRMYDRGFVAANDGNLSVRAGADRFLCTPTGVSKGFMTPDVIALLDGTGKQLDGPIPRTSEVLLHLRIYAEKPDVGAVAHAHPPHAAAFAISGLELPTGVLPEADVLIGPVARVGYHRPGSDGVSAAVLPHVRDGATTILLANHGVVGLDRTLELAYFHLETVDAYCRVLLLARQLGRIEPLTPEQLRDLLAAKRKMGLPDPRHGRRDVAPTGVRELLAPARAGQPVRLSNEQLDRLADLVAERLGRLPRKADG